MPAGGSQECFYFTRKFVARCCGFSAGNLRGREGLLRSQGGQARQHGMRMALNPTWWGKCRPRRINSLDAVSVEAGYCSADLRWSTITCSTWRTISKPFENLGRTPGPQVV